MEYQSVENPVWTDNTHTMITVDVLFPSLGSAPVKFNASPNDVMPYGQEIYADLIAGKYGAVQEPAPATTETTTTAS